MRNPSGNQHRAAAAAHRRMLPGLKLAWMIAAFGCASLAWAAQAANPSGSAPLPTSPQPQLPAQKIAQPAPPCRNTVETTTAPAGQTDAAADGAAGASGKAVTKPAPQPNAQLAPCPASGSFLINLPALKKLPMINWYARFLDGPQVKPMTPKEKAWLAVRDVADPFNAVTILGSSAIAVAANSHSAYGPGMTGFGRYVGVSYSQDMTGEFIGTFLIPSIVHQDPHYHRMPTATIKRRIAHCLYQVVWTQGDNGKGMVNYADLAGFAIDDEIADLYVPGDETNLPHTAERYATGLATAPIENFVNEFLPDVARKIHIRIVLIQQIINQVAKTDTANTSQ